MIYVACAFLALLIAFVYYPSLGAYFTADDFWHLPHLYQAISLGHTDLLWKNFCGPWVGKTTFYLFYRPITELTLASDYLLFRQNAFGYHATSMLWHYANCILVYLIGLEVLGAPNKRNQLVALVVAAIFAVHPSQAEAVAWVLARADLVGGFFILSTVYLALIYIQTKKKVHYYLMLATTALAFGSKELSACLPFVLAVVFYSRSKDLKLTLKLVAAPFAMFAAYLAIRFMSLGTILGGYVGTHGYCLNISVIERIFVPNVWWKLAHPINTYFIVDYTFFDNCLRHAYIIVAILIIFNLCLSQSIYKRFMLSSVCLVVVLLLMLVNLQVWTMYESMAGSRIFYLLLFPLCLSIVNIIVPSADEHKNIKADKLLNLCIVSASLLVIGAYSVLCNQSVEAWRSAGLKLQSMQKQLVQKIDSLPPEKKLAVINLPVIIDGTVAIYVTDFVSGLMLPPLTKKDYWQRMICLDTDFKSVNMQNLKKLAEDPTIELVLWDQGANKMDESLGPKLRQSDLDQLEWINNLDYNFKGRFERLSWRTYDNCDFYKNERCGGVIASYLLKLHAKGQIGRDLILHLENESQVNDPKEKKLVYISFDDSSKRGNNDHPPIMFELPQNFKNGEIVIPLSQEKSWLAVLPQEDLRLDLPVGYSLKQARLVASEPMKPTLALCGNIAQGPNGYFVPDSSLKELTFDFSCSHIENSCATLVEISKPNCSFCVYTGSIRDCQPSSHALKSIKLNKTDGKFSISVSDFPQPAYYQVRIAPLSRTGKILSSFGDPVAMSILSPNKN